MAYNALMNSGTADFYQDSDWAYAWIVLSELSAYYTPAVDRAASKEASLAAGADVVVRYAERKLSGMTFTAIMSALTPLGMTEGDRRRMRIELEKPKDEGESAAVLAIADYRRDLEE